MCVPLPDVLHINRQVEMRRIGEFRPLPQGSCVTRQPLVRGSIFLIIIWVQLYACISKMTGREPYSICKGSQDLQSLVSERRKESRRKLCTHQINGGERLATDEKKIWHQA
jgi:hypothetical protein